MSIYHLKDTIKQQDVFMVFLKRRQNSLDVVKHSLEKPHSKYTAQIISSIVFESSYCIGSFKSK